MLYTCKRLVGKDGVDYAIGDPIELDEDEAAALGPDWVEPVPEEKKEAAAKTVAKKASRRRST